MTMYKFVGDESSFKTFDIKDCVVEKTYLTSTPYMDGAIFTNLQLGGIEERIPVPCGQDGLQLMKRIVPAIVSHSYDGRMVAFTVRSLTRDIRIREVNGMSNYVSPSGDVNQLARELASTTMSDVDVLKSIISRAHDAICIHVQMVDVDRPDGVRYKNRVIHVNFFK